MSNQNDRHSGIRQFGWPEWVLLVLLVGSVGFTLVKGLTDQTADRAIDSAVYYVAGYAMVHGYSAYDTSLLPGLWQSALHRTHLPWLVYPYYPTSLPLVAGLGMVSPDVAFRIIDGANILSFLLIFLAVWKVLRVVQPGVRPRKTLTVLLAASLPAGFVEAIDYGQLSLIFIAALLWALYLLMKKHELSAVLLLVIFGSMKPQLTLVPGAVLLLLYARPRYWALAVGLTGGWSAVIFAAFGFGILPQFLDTLSGYGTLFFNRPDQMTGLANLFSYISLDVPAIVALGLSALGAGLVTAWFFRRRPALETGAFGGRGPLLVFMVCTLMNGFFLPLHYYDQVLLVIPLSLVFLFRLQLVVWCLPALLLASKAYWVVHLLRLPVTSESLITVCILAAAGITLGSLIREPKPAGA